LDVVPSQHGALALEFAGVVWRRSSSSPAKVFRESEDADGWVDASDLPGIGINKKIHK
jgi:hypothetical protein